MPAKKSVKKEKYGLTVSAELSDAAKRTYNIMLNYVYDDLTNTDICSFRIPAKPVFEALGMPESEDWDYLQKIMRELWLTNITFRGPGRWYADRFIYVPRILAEEGLIGWEYSPPLREVLKTIKEVEKSEDHIGQYIIENILEKDSD